MKNKPIVYIILLNYNNYQDTLACFESLQNITYKNHRIVIVENNSPNNSMDRFKEYFNRQDIKYSYHPSLKTALTSQSDKALLTLIQSGRNGGYGFGNNIGIKYAVNNDADYILILNNDTIVDKHFLEPMVEMCEDDERIGIVSGKIYFHDKQDTIWFNGGEFNPWTGSVKHCNFNEKDVGQKPPDEITFISGCFMLLPKNVVDQVGLFNEDYFMYVEDLEFCYEIIKKGLNLRISEHSTIFHKVGQSLGGHLSESSVYMNAKNKFTFFKTKLSFPQNGMSILSLCIIESIRWLFKKKPSLFRKHILGLFDAIRS